MGIAKKETTMKNEKFRKMLARHIEEEGVEEDVLLLENHTFDNSVVGISVEGRLVYDFNKMIEEFCEDEGCDELEALEWLEYNTLRALPYMGPRRPIIIIGNRDTLMEKYGEDIDTFLNPPKNFEPNEYDF